MPCPEGAPGRVSLYADDVAIFLTSSVSDMSNLADILQNFGDVMGLATNVAKSSIASIRCINVDLNFVLENFPDTLAQFPLKYLGLPVLRKL
jgi:hypothetical protein